MALRLRKRVWIWLAVLLGTLVLLVALAPRIIGSSWIYGPLIRRLAADDILVSIDRVTLRWFSPLRLSGIELHQRDGRQLMTIAEVNSDRSLWGYLVGGRRLGRIDIVRPTVSVELLQEGSNLERFIAAIDATASGKDRATRKRPAVDVQVMIDDFSAQVIRADETQPLVVVPPLDVDIQYRAAEGDSLITVQPTRLLDRVKITRELIDLGLGHALPLLAKSAWFDGSVSLDIGAIEVPLDRPLEGHGTFQLTLHQVRSGPNDPNINQLLDFIAKIRQKESLREIVFIDGSRVDGSVAGGRVHHSGLRFGLPTMDTRLQVETSGSVGIQDKSLDMIVALPLPVEQLALREQVQKLGVPNLRLKVTGTLDEPKVDWQAMRGEAAGVLGAMRQALGEEAPRTTRVLEALEGLAEGDADQTISTAVDILEQLRQRRKARRQQSQ